MLPELRIFKTEMGICHSSNYNLMDINHDHNHLTPCFVTHPHCIMNLSHQLNYQLPVCTLIPVRFVDCYSARTSKDPNQIVEYDILLIIKYINYVSYNNLNFIA
jgi:hypothetical protein